MADGKCRRNVRGMIVRGISLTTLFPIPLTIIPLTSDLSRKVANRESCREGKNGTAHLECGKLAPTFSLDSFRSA